MKTRFLCAIAFLLGLQALLAQPTITSVDPLKARVSETITIRGTGFSGDKKENKVTFGNPDAEGKVLSAEEQVLEVRVPADAESGKISVEVNSQTVESTADFTRLNPTVDDFIKFISPGFPVIINGANFAKITKAAQGVISAVHANEVCFNDICIDHASHKEIDGSTQNVPYVTVNDEGTRLTAYIEDAIPHGTGTLKVKIGDQEVEAGEYTSRPAPEFTATSVTPTSAGMGETITITGTGLYPRVRVGMNFTASNELSTIYEINDDQTQIKVRISPNVRGREGDINQIEVLKCLGHPASGCASREIKVTDGFTVPVTPDLTITGFSPMEARPGAVITIRGTGFSPHAPDAQVRFGGGSTITAPHAHEVNTAGTELKVRIPLSGGRAGKITVFYLGNALFEEHRAISTDDFTIDRSAPTITNFSPTSGGPGDEITIEGNGFSPYAPYNEIAFSFAAGTEPKYVAADWVNEDGTQLRATIGRYPFPTRNGMPVTDPQLIAVKIGSIPPGVSDDKFTLQNIPKKPVVTNFTPTEGGEGSEVMITGENFSTTPTENTVTFGGDVTATPSAATATSLTVQVPSGARTGPIKVTVDGHTGTSAATFTVPGTEPVPPPNPNDILNVPEAEGVRVYPNPASQEVRLTNLPTAAHAYRIYSLAGKVALTGGAARGSAAIDVSGLARGQYVLVLQAEDGNETLRTRLLLLK